MADENLEIENQEAEEVIEEKPNLQQEAEENHRRTTTSARQQMRHEFMTAMKARGIPIVNNDPFKSLDNYVAGMTEKTDVDKQRFENLNKTVSELQVERDSLVQKLKTVGLESEIKDAFKKNNCNDPKSAAILFNTEYRIETDEDGNRIIYSIEGNKMQFNEKGQQATIEDVAKKWLASHDMFIPATQRSSAGGKSLTGSPQELAEVYKNPNTSDEMKKQILKKFNVDPGSVGLK